jgi:hypothetical protein
MIQEIGQMSFFGLYWPHISLMERALSHKQKYRDVTEFNLSTLYPHMASQSWGHDETKRR